MYLFLHTISNATTFMLTTLSIVIIGENEVQKG